MLPVRYQRLRATVFKSIIRSAFSQELRPRAVVLPLIPIATTRRDAASRRASRRAYHQATMSTTSENQAAGDLPPLSAHEFKGYNRLAEKMNYFHEHFRSQWNLLWNACTANRRPSNMTLKQFIDEGLLFAQYLTTHHSIEETYFFPMLAKKMPEFQKGAAGELIQQHREIHAGLDQFEAYLKACRAREVDFEMDVLKSKMEGWGGVLWTHLDQEVKTLGAENMRRYWTLDEVRRFQI